MTDPNLTHARTWIERALPRVTSDVVLRIQDWEPLVDACAAALAAAVRAKGEADADIATKRYAFVLADELRAHAADVPPPPGTP